MVRLAPSLTAELKSAQLVGSNSCPQGLLACLYSRALLALVWTHHPFQLASLPTQIVPTTAAPTCLTGRSHASGHRTAAQFVL